MILTVVHLPPHLHCPSIWSVTPAPTPSDLVQQISLKPSPTAVSQFSVTLTVELLPTQYNCLVTRTVSPVVKIDLTKNQANSKAPQTAQILTVAPYRSKRILLKSTSDSVHCHCFNRPNRILQCAASLAAGSHDWPCRPIKSLFWLKPTLYAW